MSETRSQDIPQAPADGAARRKRCGFWGWCVRGSLLATLLVVIVLSVLAYVFLRPENVRQTAITALERLTQADVAVGFAQLTWRGDIVLENVALRIPGVDGPGGRLAEVDRLVITPTWSSILSRGIQVDKLDFTHLQLHIIQDAATSQYAVEQWASSLAVREAQLPDTLPEVKIDRAVLAFAEIENGQYVVNDRFDARVDLRPDPRRPSTFVFQLDPIGVTPREQPTAFGSIDLKAGVVTARLGDFMFDPSTARLLPERLRQWWRNREPQGHVVQLDVLLSPDASGKPTLAAQLRFDDGGVTLPFESIETRMSNVTGDIKLADDRVVIDELTGVVAGVDYSIHGHIDAFDPEPPLRVTITTKPFEIPQKLGQLYALPQAVLGHYDRLNPSGIYAVQAVLERHETGGQLHHRTVINVIDGRMTYHKFRYPLQHITGRIVITDQEAVVESLTGFGRNGMKVEMQGHIAPVGREAQVDLSLYSANLAIDEPLMNALEPHRRRVIEQFFNQPSYHRLLDLGVLRNKTDEAPKNPDAPGPPVFVLGGTARVSVRLHRPPGPDRKYLTYINVDPTGLSAVMRGWPYPVTATEGAISVSPEGATIQGLHLKGPTGARAIVDGRFEPDVKDGKLKPDIRLHDVTMPLDELLIATLPDKQASWMHTLGVEGSATAEARVTRDEDGIAFAATGRIVSGSLNPFSGPIRFEPLTGAFELTRSSLKITDVRASHAEVQLAANIESQWTKDKPPSVNAMLDLTQMRLRPQLLEVMPEQLPVREQLATLLKRYDLTATLDAQVQLTLASDGAIKQTATLRPAAMNLTYHGTPIAIRDMHGSAILAGNRLELSGLGGDFGDMQLDLTGVVLTGESPAASLTFDAKGDKIGPAMRAVLPPAVVKAMEGLSFDTAYEVKQARFSWQPDDDAKPPMQFTGDIAFRGAHGVVALPFRDADGSLAVHIEQDRATQRPRCRMTLNVDRVLIRDRLVQPLRMEVLSSDDLKTLLFADIRGVTYGGTLTGAANVSLENDQRYAANLTVQNAELMPMLDPQAYAEQQAGDGDAASGDASDKNDSAESASGGTSGGASGGGARRNVDSGLISLSLTVEGRPGDLNAMRGRGQLDITRARLFKHPLALVLLHTINLALPVSDSFEAVSSSFTLLGPSVRFQSLTFWSKFAAITGKGVMTLPDTKLDLAMVARNPSGPDLGALGDMVNALKDELVGIRVDGTLENPKARITSFEGVRAAWRKVFDDSAE